MKPENLFKELLEMYSEKIDLVGNVLHSNGGATVPNLITEHDRAEKLYLGISPEHEAMGWSIMQALHTKAKTLIVADEQILDTRELIFKDVSNYYSDNLQSIKEQRKY